MLISTEYNAGRAFEEKDNVQFSDDGRNPGSPLLMDADDGTGAPGLDPFDPPRIDWMWNIPDHIAISIMNIPGTHESAALHGGDMVQCQELSIPDQLRYGIRFLDIRCRPRQVGVFAIHHDHVFQNLYLDDVLKSCIKFLTDHPTETILMRIKQVTRTNLEKAFEPFGPVYKDSNDKFTATFRYYMDVKGYKQWVYTKERVPTLGEVRGKIVIISNHNGVSGNPWGSLKRQDEWSVPTIFHRSRTLDYVKGHLYKAMKADYDTRCWSDNDKIFINFASGSSGGAYPYTVAKYVNYYLYEELARRGASSVQLKNCMEFARYCIVVLDFPYKYAEGIVPVRIKSNYHKHLDLFKTPLYTMFNTMYKNYLAPHWHIKRVTSQRQVVGWRNNHVDMGSYWHIIQNPQREHTLLFSVYYRGYMYASANVIDNRRQVYTGIDGWATPDWAYWRMINRTDGTYSFKSVRYNEYFYESGNSPEEEGNGAHQTAWLGQKNLGCTSLESNK